MYLRVGSFARRVRNHYDGQSCRTNWGRGGRSWSGSVSTTGPPARKRGFVVRIGVGIGVRVEAAAAAAVVVVGVVGVVVIVEES